MKTAEPGCFDAGQTVDGRAICGAKTRAGTPCQRSPLAGRTRCKLHGGASPRGVASPAFRHGRFSSVMPARLAEAYRRAEADPAGISVAEEMHLLSARQTELLEALDKAAGPAVWREATKAWRAFKKAQAGGDVDGMHSAVADLDAIFAGRVDWSVWSELRETIEGRRRLAETERRRIEAAEAYVTLVEMRAYGAAINAAILESVPDAKARAIIAEAVERAWLPYRRRELPAGVGGDP